MSIERKEKLRVREREREREREKERKRKYHSFKTVSLRIISLDLA